MTNLDQYEVTPDWVTESSTQDLIPTGTYEGILQGFKTRDVENAASPFYGYPMIRAQVELYGVEGRTRQHFFDLSPRLVKKGDGKLRQESKLMADLARATGMAGKRVPDVLAGAMTMRLRYRVRLTEERDTEDGKHYDARNWTDAITAVR